MNKANVLLHLKRAKPEHIEWIKQGHRLLQGAPQEQLKKPVECTDCSFGEWYYKEGFKLVNIPQLKDLETLHQEIHKTYTALYFITFDRRKAPRATIIRGDVEVPVQETLFREKKLKQLEKKTVAMIRSLNDIEKKVQEMKDTDFESGWFM